MSRPNRARPAAANGQRFARTTRRSTSRVATAAALRFVQRWSLVVVGLLLWELAARSAETVFFPPPTRIVATLVSTWLGGPVTQLFLSDLAVAHLLPSLGRLAGAWASAVVIGVAAGIALGRSRVALDYLGPLFAFCRAIPPPVLVPVFIVLLDLGTPMQLATIVFGVVWPILLNAIDGARSVHRTQHDTAAAFRVSRQQWVTEVVLPAALPKIFAGLRISLSIGLILMVISELVGATNGIGYQLSQSRSTFDYPNMWAIVVLLGILGYVFNAVLLRVEHRVLRWQPNRAGANNAHIAGS